MNKVCELCEEGKKIRTDCPENIFCARCFSKLNVPGILFEVKNNKTGEMVGGWFELELNKKEI